METAYSLSDIAAAMGENNGFGGNGAWILIILFALIFGWGGNGFGGRSNDFGQFATSASQSEILLGQQFQTLNQAVNQVGDGLCSSTYALNNSILGEGRAIQTQLANCCCENQRNTDSLRYDMATQIAGVNANTTAQTQKILDAICQNKIDSLQAQVSELKTQNMFCGIPRISNYAYGVYPYATQGCGMNAI